MARRKTLQQLTIKDDFMFGAVMADEENCKQFLELVLGFPIRSITVSKEKSMIYHPEYKGIRLDIIAKDEAHTHYNVEMQVARKKQLGKRSRYYHSQLDMELLLAGSEYDKLPNAYVIFICDYDPFGKKKYCYTFDMKCKEDDTICLKDGSHTIFLSTCGTNESEVPRGLVNFLKYVKAGLNEDVTEYEDSFVQRLKHKVENVKKSREMEGRYMVFKELLQEEREEGKAEGKAEGLMEVIFDILDEKEEKLPECIREIILSENNLDILKDYLKKAIRAKSMEDFVAKINSK